MKAKKWMITVLALVIAMATVTALAAPTVLRLGSSGEQVRTLQSKLKQWGYYSGSVDGVFGSQTQEAVKYFQRRNGLTADGVVGSATAAALGMNLGSSSASSSASSGSVSSDVYLLARVVHGEARGEPYLGKVAVAAVVLNRVASASFPNTIAGVVYQANAFTAVSDGQINLTPDAESIRAARDAMNGWDPTGGALYYYNPAIATSSWIYSRKVVAVIRKHYFRGLKGKGGGPILPLFWCWWWRF